MEIKTGAEYTAKTVVDQTNVASAVGSGLVEVFATPMMIALLELAASKCIENFLDEGQASVGTHINVSHTAATPVGMAVYATARVTATDRRKVEFAVSIRDESGLVGEGVHTRFIIDKEKFMSKAREKLGE